MAASRAGPKADAALLKHLASLWSPGLSPLSLQWGQPAVKCTLWPDRSQDCSSCLLQTTGTVLKYGLCFGGPRGPPSRPLFLALANLALSLLLRPCTQVLSLWEPCGPRGLPLLCIALSIEPWARDTFFCASLADFSRIICYDCSPPPILRCLIKLLESGLKYGLEMRATYRGARDVVPRSGRGRVGSFLCLQNKTILRGSQESCRDRVNKVHEG